MVRTIILLLHLSLLYIALPAQQYTIGTYNIRYANPRDTGNLWVSRMPIVVNLIRFHDFDILGTQEGLKPQIDDISAALPQYARYGAGRDDGNSKGEHSAIFYKKEKFQLIDKGDFWLSETPDTPSLGWDATCCNRICSWVQLLDSNTRKTFYVFNVHFDHQGVKARKESGKLIIEKIKSLAGNNPVIFMGDLNGSQSSDWYQTIANSGVVKDTYRQVEHPYVNNASHNGFGATRNKMDIIDHIFVTSQFSVSKWGLLTDTYHGKFPSDHFPVLVKINL